MPLTRSSQTDVSLDLTKADELAEEFGGRSEKLVALLQGLQDHYGYLPQEALERVCEKTGLSPARLMGVATFYTQFRFRPAGKHHVKVCIGTACHVKGAAQIYDAFRKHLDLAEGEDTDAEGRFTVEEVACLGCCTLAPAVQIDDVTYGHLTTESVGHVLDDFLSLHRKGSKPAALEIADDKVAGEVRISLDTCCIARGSDKVYEALARELARTGAPVRLKRVGCAGISYMEPLVEVVVGGKLAGQYAQVSPDDARGIVLKHFKPRGFIRRARTAVSGALDHLLTDEAWLPVHRYAMDARDPEVNVFLDRQVRIATQHSGDLNPLDLEEYKRGGGLVALGKAAEELTAEEIIRQVSASGLRGRGGAGFPTGRKWANVRAAEGDVKYIICNCDEGDPGAFMDRMLLESYPYRIIEGLAVAGLTIGAEEGYFYVRAEYPLAIRRLTEALRRCREKGIIGEGILGSGKRLELSVVQGAGAFVCGEETALLASIEGRRGMPRLRPPYPAEKGLWGQPTLVNNVETYAAVPWILREGPEAFAALGTEKSKGTKVFALAGKVMRGGLVEVPMGATIRQVVEEIGGGIPGGKAFKAVQIGGPSGGCVPARLAETPIDYEALQSAGAIMGSGGLVVLDEDDCMVDIARYFLRFTQDQSCGKCTFCRIGTREMLEILDRLCEGRGEAGDLERLEELGKRVSAGSLCGLGQTAPNPVVSALEYFRDEFEAHLEGRCPAGQCPALITYSITDDCIGCTLCAQHCPADAIEMRPHEKHEIDPEKCVRCDSCRQICPAEAVKVE